jgi:Putative small multi-drug export protein.
MIGTRDITKIILPLAAASLLLTFCWYAQKGMFLLMLIYFLTPLGRFSMYPFLAVGEQTTINVFGTAIDTTGFSLSIGHVIIAIIMVDVLCSWFLIWNFDYAKSIPGIGKLFEKSETRGRAALEKHLWIRSFAYSGIVLFMMQPLYGTDAIIGTIIAKICGFNPIITLVCVILGSLLGALIVAIPMIGFW